MYDLLDADALTIYIGSTSDLHSRLRAHAKDKPWHFYAAGECADRETAYWLEAREIAAYRPQLNRDRSVGGRARLAPPFPPPDPTGPLLAHDWPPSCGHEPRQIGCCDWDSPAAQAYSREEWDLHYNAS